MIAGSWSDLAAGARLVAGLPSYLWQRLDAPGATALVAALHAARETAFLTQLRQVFATASSPYRALLRHARCEYGDVEALTRREGLEPALATLCRTGVYLTVDEFKGRCPIVRAGTPIACDPSSLRRRGAARVLTAWSSGSRGARTAAPLDLAAIRHRAVHTGLPLIARGGEHWTTGVWGVPGASLGTVLQYAVMGARPTRWFLQIDPRADRLPARYRWSARAARGRAWHAWPRFHRHVLRRSTIRPR